MHWSDPQLAQHQSAPVLIPAPTMARDASGLPVEGFWVVTGISTAEKVAEIINGLKSVGIRHVAFKPGSVEGIRQVVNIAGANPDFAIIMQWTGGRARGHHSYSPFSRHTRAFGVMTILPLLQSLALEVRMPRFLIFLGTGRCNSVWSRCPLISSSSRLRSWLPRKRNVTIRQGSHCCRSWGR
jgi:hypothetical protein